jgi:pimeloyl-ACP methyl ester carboxylesterase
MRILPALLLLALIPVAAAQRKLEIKDLQNHPFAVEFPSGSSLRMRLQSGDFHVSGSDDNRIAIHVQGKNIAKARNLTVQFVRSGQGGDLRVFGGPRKEFRVTIEIPKSTNLYVRMRGGDLKVEGVVGNKDVSLTGGDLAIEVGDPSIYALVDASVRFGDVLGDAFGDPKGWLGGALRKQGAGKYDLRAHVFAGDLILTSSLFSQETAGEWVGEISLSNDWQLLQLHVERAPDEIKGTLDLPLQGAMGIQMKDLQWDIKGVAFGASGPAGDMDFTGEIKDGILQGAVREAKSTTPKGSFQLAHIAKITPDAYAGGYEAEDGRLITLSVWPEQTIDLTRLLVQYTDARSGRFGSLFPLSESRFVSGGPLARIFPIEIEVTFEKNSEGKIAGLTWREGSLPEIHARKTTPYHEEQVTFRNQNVTLAGTLVVPLGKGLHPAVVFTHGSGAQIRQRGVLEQLLVRHGVAVLTYDKRGMGDSTGDWKNASFTDLANDAVAGATLLTTRADIDPKRIGFWGLSQGGWIAPLAAARFGQAAFVIAASGGGLSPEQQELLDTESALRDGHFSEADIAEALAFQKAKNAFMQTGSAWDTYQALLQAEKDKKWYGFETTDAWGPESKDDPFWATTRSFYFYDPAPALQGLRCPILFIFGDLDDPKGVQENVANLKSWLQTGGDRDVTIKVFPNAGHNLFVGESDYMAAMTSDRLRFTPGYLNLVQSWVVGHVGIQDTGR